MSVLNRSYGNVEDEVEIKYNGKTLRFMCNFDVTPPEPDVGLGGSKLISLEWARNLETDEHLSVEETEVESLIVDALHAQLP